MSTIFLLNLKQQQKKWKYMLQYSGTMTSWVQVWHALRLFTTQFSDKVLLDYTRYMKFNGMRIKEILRRIWSLSANKIKPSESICKQSSQVKLELNLSFWQTVTAIYCRNGKAGHSFGFQNSKIDSFLYSKAFCSPHICLARKQMWMKKIRALFLSVRFLTLIQPWLMKFLIMSWQTK